MPRKKPIQRVKEDEETEKYVPNERTTQKLRKMKIGDLPDKEFQIMVINMLTELKRRMDKYSDNFNRDIKYKYQIEDTEMKNTTIELKNPPEDAN